jgi:CDP-paratose 2-epimerase
MKMKDMNNNKPVIGIMEYFQVNDFDNAALIIEDIKKLGVTELRTVISWADWYSKEGEKWYNWLFPELAKNFNLLPCLTYTPPELGIEPKIFSPPRNTGDFNRFVDILIKRYGEHFEAVELWNEPNNLNSWDWRLDPDWNIFSEMITSAVNTVKEAGKTPVLGGMAPVDPNWLKLMGEKNILQQFDVIALHGFHGTWESDWNDWNTTLAGVDDVLKIFNHNPQVWITKAGYSTWKHDEHKQLSEFVKLINCGADKVYWYSVRDLNPDVLIGINSPYEDERFLHFGMKYHDGQSKLLYRIWQEEGIQTVEAMANIRPTLRDNRMQELRLIKTPLSNRRAGIRQTLTKMHNRPVLIFGGAGFIGTNTAHKYLSNGKPVRIFDNLSRPGVEKNLQYLYENYKDLVDIEIGDIRDAYAVKNVVRDVREIYDFAAQVAVTTSLENPIHDFEVNVKGTINILEAVRSLPSPIPVFFTSTNKVYGNIDDLKLKHNGLRYYPESERIKKNGIDERRPLDFHSPYGCSKGAADQYVMDYSRSYNIPTVVFRMSCIYGPHQFGNEDQGWVAHFMLQALNNKPVTIFGDGKQVRDILYVDDLVHAFFYAQENLDAVAGQAFNIGGGTPNSMSLLELIREIETISGNKVAVDFEEWRTSDQKYFVSSISKFSKLTGWQPKVSAIEGIEKLYYWLNENRMNKPERPAPVKKDFRKRNKAVYY